MKALYIVILILVLLPGICWADDSDNRDEKQPGTDMTGFTLTSVVGGGIYWGTWPISPRLPRVIYSPFVGLGAGLLYDGCFNQDGRPFWERAIWDVASAPIIPLISYYIEGQMLIHNRARGFAVNVNPAARRVSASAWFRF